MNHHNFPKIHTDKDGKKTIYDALRQRFVAFTPEECVRQEFIQFLITEKHYPQTLLANEVAISLNGTQKRCDSVLYDIHLKPRMIIEYKAPSVKISQQTFNQILRYNIALHVEYLIVTNSIQTFACKINKQSNNTISFLKNIPEYADL